MKLQAANRLKSNLVHPDHKRSGRHQDWFNTLEDKDEYLKKYPKTKFVDQTKLVSAKLFAQMLQADQGPGWFFAQVLPQGFAKTGNGIRYVYVRKSQDGGVTVFNGRHYIHTWTKEEARMGLQLVRKLTPREQEETNRDYDWYLNY